jgi:hypothetical protein
MLKLKLTRTLDITIGSEPKTLKVVRVLAKQATSHQYAQSVPAAPPYSIVTHESVMVVVRSHLGDFPALYGGTASDSVPYAEIRFGEDTVKAMVRMDEPDLSEHHGEILLTFLLLRVPVAALDFPEDDWERDEEHSYSRDGIRVTAIRPKPPSDVFGRKHGDDEWKHLGTATGPIEPR